MTATNPPRKDPESERIEQQAARAEARAKAAGVATTALGSLAPGQSDVPKGDVTLGEGAGSLGPWLAHRVLAGAGREIAAAVQAALAPLDGTAAAGPASRVLVTADPNLLDSDVHGQLLLAALTARRTELDSLAATIGTAVTELGTAVARYRAEEDATESGGADSEIETPEGLDFEIDSTEEEKEDAPTAGRPINVAVDLLRLLATDVTLTPVTVSADASLLALLTAGALAGEATLDVVLDGFEVARPNGPTLAALAKVREASRSAAERTLELAAAVAPVEQELTLRTAALEAVEKSWREASVAKDVTPEQVAVLAARRDALTSQVASRTAAVGPAKAVIEKSIAVLEMVSGELAAATAVDESGASPIARAAAREALHAPAQPITHVLYVEPAHTGADVVTRRSILGASGRVSYLGAANAGWALLAVEVGTLVAGGSVDGVDQFTHDLTSGGSALIQGVPTAELASLGDDMFAKHERALRNGVFILAVGVALLGVAAVLGVVLGPILALWR